MCSAHSDSAGRNISPALVSFTVRVSSRALLLRGTIQSRSLIEILESYRDPSGRRGKFRSKREAAIGAQGARPERHPLKAKLDSLTSQLTGLG